MATSLDIHLGCSVQSALRPPAKTPQRVLEETTLVSPLIFARDRVYTAVRTIDGHLHTLLHPIGKWTYTATMPDNTSNASRPTTT
jgi:hypothetical protein